MVTGKKNVFGCAANYLRGKKCVFCGSFRVLRTSRDYVKCRNGVCGRSKSLTRLRREIAILQGFYQRVPAYRLAQDLGVDVKVITRVYQRLREALFHPVASRCLHPMRAAWRWSTRCNAARPPRRYRQAEYAGTASGRGSARRCPCRGRRPLRSPAPRRWPTP